MEDLGESDLTDLSKRLLEFARDIPDEAFVIRYTKRKFGDALPRPFKMQTL